MQEFRWVPHVLALELKKALSYRLNFWVQFFMGTGTELTVAYFVWKAVFAARGTDELQGFSFHGIVFYSLFASFAAKLTRGSDRGYVSQDIYDGCLTRYLLYPLPFFPYKYITHFTQQLMGTLQLLIAYAALRLILNDNGNYEISPFTFLAGIFTCLLSGYVFFVMASCLELVAFWQDVIWNLMVMLRFAVNLLGGAMLPLSLFPDWGRQLAELTPFPALIYFPTRTFLGQVSLAEWLHYAALLLLWGIAFSFLLNWIWKQGTKQYSGVGV